MRGMPHRALVVGAVAGMALGASAQIVDSSFTYQGLLEDSGVNYTGSADFVFRMWDAPVGGTFLGDSTELNVSVTNGLFSTELDFGADAIDAPNRYLQIFVRTPSGSGSYTSLASRQKLSATPYAVQTRGWFTNNEGVSALRDPATQQGLFFDPTPTGFGAHLWIQNSATNKTIEIPRSDGAGFIRFFESSTNGLGASIGGGSFSPNVGGFLELDDSNGPFFPLVRIYADQDLDNTDSDADALIRLASNGGAGAIGAQLSIENGSGGVQTIELDGGPLESGGTVRIREDDGVETIRMAGGTTHGRVDLFAEGGESIAVLTEDPSSGPPSGSLALPGAQGSFTTLIESDFASSGDPFLQMVGSDRSIILRTDFEGDGSAALPLNSIGPTETLAEAGVASVLGAGTIPSSGVATNIASRSITCPAPGFVLVIASGELQVSHVNGNVTSVAVGVSDVSGAFPNSSQDVEHSLPSNAPSGVYDDVATVHGLFSVPAGTSTFYVVGDMFAGPNNAFMGDTNMTLLYVPTAYGEVNSNEERAPGVTDQQAVALSSPMTQEDVFTEQIMAQQHHILRLETELATFRAQQDEMMRMIRELNPGSSAQAPTPMREYDDRTAALAPGEE